MQIEKTFNQHSNEIRYLLHVPDEVEKHPGYTFPLILFLHGAGERGDDLETVKDHGIPSFLDNDRSFPFIVVSPQCSIDSYWTEDLDGLMALLKYMVSSYPVDKRRIYLTGMSMGGVGTWNLALKYPNYFAALVPVCGAVTLPEHRCKEFKELVTVEMLPEELQILQHTPIWAFHGDQDDVIPMDETVRITNYLKQFHSKVYLTIYPGVGHDSWTSAYHTRELYKWLLQQKLS
ncbi:Prolyl oligopeptidase family protein [Gracilibacillus orientalis]|uniref:Prolyl oligopeptidase family protein n=1 Tax=Gracilibacillus orientalis TaxID=334253 RepID=A0A1I4JUV5_9BACI|nr:prolyl oligopeptidase family serine peptidase [Gracilibacillus orientalis]SFL70358.1 Prolyl oligopeptidase family protein [Gracilibacillus orientalis]